MLLSGLTSERFAPAERIGRRSSLDCDERFPQFLGHGTRLAVADNEITAVETYLTHGDDRGGGAANEHFPQFPRSGI